MLLTFIILWTIAGILIFYNPKSENTRWGAVLAFISGFGGLSESIQGTFRPVLNRFDLMNSSVDKILDTNLFCLFCLSGFLGSLYFQNIII